MKIKTVNNYPKYKVSENGLVIGARGGLLKPDYNRTGYKRVTLCKGGVTKRVFVHRLVAEHFLDAPKSPDCIVNHIDGDKTNNHYTNLEWTTHKENLRHALDTGLRDMKNKVEMSPEQRKKVEIMLAYGGTYQRIADIVGVTYNAVAIINSRLKERATTIRKE